MQQPVIKLWQQVLQEYLEPRRNFVTRKASKGGGRYVSAPDVTSIAHACRRMAKRVELPEKYHPTIEDIRTALDELDMIISYDEMNARVATISLDGDEVTGYFKRGEGGKLATGKSGRVRCTAKSAKNFKRGGTQDHMMGEESLKIAQQIRTRIKWIATDQGLC